MTELIIKKIDFLVQVTQYRFAGLKCEIRWQLKAMSIISINRDVHICLY